jgi:hypothetical protein
MNRFAVSFLVLVSLSASFAAALGVGGAKAGANQAAFGLNCGLGLTDQLVPLVLRDDKHRLIPPRTYNFRLVCSQHDKCYAHWGMDRSNCDHAFILNMFAECNRQPKAAQHGCDYVALKYHDAVVRQGAAAYKQAQLEAIVTGLEGDYNGVGSLIASGGPNGPVSIPWSSFALPTLTVTAAGDGLFLGREGIERDASDGAESELDITSDYAGNEVTATATDDVIVGDGMLPGYVGGGVQIDLTFTWHGGPLPASVTGTFSGGSLVDDRNQEPVTFSGSFTASKSIQG